MAYDSARGVTVLFGGDDYYDGGAYGHTWEWNGYAWLDKGAAAVATRVESAMAYDSMRGVTVLFGGNNPPRGDTWEWDGVSWSLRGSAGPEPRYNHAMAYDSARGVTVLFGGYFFQFPNYGHNDTWEWNGADWTFRGNGGPSRRDSHVLAYDSARGVVVLFGGRAWNLGTATLVGDTWEWDGTIWTERGVVGPSRRWRHAMANDPLRGVTILFGGQAPDGTSLGDTWEWNGQTWTQRSATGPAARFDHAMAYDEARGVVVLQGGEGSPLDTWGWDGQSWTKRADVSLPRLSGGAAVAYELASRETLVCGVASPLGQPSRGETWSWDGDRWLLRAIGDPTYRGGHSIAYDELRSVTVLFGGYDAAPGSQPSPIDTWEWDGMEWTQRTVSGPPARVSGAMAYDVTRGVTVLYGGYFTDASDFEIRNDTWEWNGMKWSFRTFEGPGPRYDHGMTFDKSRSVTVVFGGLGYDSVGCGELGDTWEWDGTAWTLRSASGPHARQGARLVFDGDRNVTVLYGGYWTDSYCQCCYGDNDTWEWDGSVWTERTAAAGSPLPIVRAIAYDSGRRAIVMPRATEPAGNAYEYTCECITIPGAPEAETYFSNLQPGYATKNRYLSFAASAPECSLPGPMALRVTLTQMPGSADCPRVPDFSAFNGAQMWVGPEVVTNGGTSTGVHALQPTPYFDPWNVAGGVIQVSDCNIVPCATYTIEAIRDIDYPGGPYSAPLVLQTTPMWGDIVGNAGAPADGVVSALDVTAMVNRFKNLPGAQPRTWCDVHANNPIQGVNLNIDALDITTVVNAFKSFDYPYPGPSAPLLCPQ